MEHLLATGERPRELIAYFGADEYHELVPLAREAQRVPVAAEAPSVFLVPGIMGSQLGRTRRAPLPNDILWLDPVDIGVGNLALLRLPGDTPIVPMGVVLYTYLRLKLHLRIAGFAPIFHDYDWRLGVDELGRALAERLRAMPSRRVMIVAHSMGGLVSRAALACNGMHKIERIVLLGTPNLGSFAPVQALRGTYAVVRKIARLAESQSAELLAAHVFSTFPSLYHLLPPPAVSDLDLFDATIWPQAGPRPNVRLLANARTLGRALAPADDRVIVIAGAGQETVTGIGQRNGEFVYTITRHGDGTVPTVCALLAGARTYYTKVAHSELARDRVVAHAIAELLHTGDTRHLPTKSARGGTAAARISDRELRRAHAGKVEWGDLTPEARQRFLQNLNEPPKLQLRVPAKLKRRKPKAAPKRASGRSSRNKRRA